MSDQASFFKNEKTNAMFSSIQREVDALRRTVAQFPTETPLAWLQNITTDDSIFNLVEAFGSRFSRLQDGLGDKLLPVLLDLNLIPLGTVLDNLNRAERLGWIRSVDAWRSYRSLRNRLVHEYIHDLDTLQQALKEGLAGVADLEFAWLQMSTTFTQLKSTTK